MVRSVTVVRLWRGWGVVTIGVRASRSAAVAVDTRRRVDAGLDIGGPLTSVVVGARADIPHIDIRRIMI
jgi:hypothetical protein